MLIALLMPFTAAHATLMTVDSPLGPETAVLDTNTELEWLKVSITANTTPGQVFAEMTSGGRLQGFRYATANEFTCGLVGVELLRGGCSADWLTNDVAIVQAFLDLLGAKFNEIGLFGVQIDPQGLNFPPNLRGNIHARSFATCPIRQSVSQLERERTGKSLARAGGANDSRAIYLGAARTRCPWVSKISQGPRCVTTSKP
jgi:hypothetical protein